ASVDDPAIATTVDRALVLATVSPAGVLLSEVVIIKEGDMLPGIPIETLTDVGTGPHDSAFNNLGKVLFAAELTGPAATGAALALGSTSGITVLAREGDPSPIAGRLYATLNDIALDLNDSDEWVAIADLDGATTDDSIIVKNGTTVIAREGSGLPAIGAFTFTTFGTGAVRIDNGGNVFWYGDWNDTVTTQDTGIFRNGQLVVQEGVTMVGG